MFLFLGGGRKKNITMTQPAGYLASLFLYLLNNTGKS
jgi:hypothetical protein